MDFDDLLLLTEELFENHAVARQAEAALFDHLLVDEYQDTNGSQYRIIKASRRRTRDFCASWGTTISRFTAGAEPKCSTF